MGDVIYRQDAIRVLNAKCKKAFNLTCGEEDCACAEYMALRDLPSAQQWIPCSERLPDAQTEVIVSCMDDLGDTRFLYTSSGWVTTDREYWIVDNEINSFVKAWMPLPEPYREEVSD